MEAMSWLKVTDAGGDADARDHGLGYRSIEEQHGGPVLTEVSVSPEPSSRSAESRAP